MKGLEKKYVLLFLLMALLLSLVIAQNNGYKFRHITTKHGLPSNAVNAMIKDSDGFMWFATDNGLARYDGYNIKKYQIPRVSTFGLESQVVNALFEDKEGNFWVGTSQGLQLFDRMTKTFKGYLHNPENAGSLSNNAVNTIYQDKSGILWIGTNGGLNKLDCSNNKFDSYRQDDTNSESLIDQILAIFEDNTGTFWIGTADGMFWFDREEKSFTKFELVDEIPEGMWRRITCITEDKYGHLWIGSYWGMYEYKIENEELVHYTTRSFLDQSQADLLDRDNFLSHDVVMSVAMDKFSSDDILWIATQYGLNRFNVNRGTFEKFYEKPDDPNSISTDLLYTLYLDDCRQLWIGTFTKGVEMVNTSTNPFHHVKVKTNRSDDIIWQPISFLIDLANTCWVGAFDEGLFHYDKDYNLIAHYDLWEFDPNNYDRRHNDRITCIYEDSDSLLLLGFYEWGLVKLNKNEKTFTKVELIPEITSPIQIDHIIRDQKGILWIGSNQGLYTQMDYGDFNGPAFVVDHKDLSKAEILSVFEDKRGQLWISTRNSGLFVQKPENKQSMLFTTIPAKANPHNSYTGDYVRSVYEDKNGSIWIATNAGLNKFNDVDQILESVYLFNKEYGGEIIKIFGDDQNNLWLFHSDHGLLRYQPYSEKRKNVKVFDVRDGLPFDNFNTKYYNTNSFYQSKDGRLFIGCDVGSRKGFFWFHPEKIRGNDKIPGIVITQFKVGNEAYILDSLVGYKRHITLNHNENFFSLEFSALNYLMPEKNEYAYYLKGLEDDWIYSGTRRFANYTGVPPGEYTFRVKGSNNDGYWNEEGTYVHISVLPPFWKTWWAYSIYGLMAIAFISFIFHYYFRRQRLLHKLALEHVEKEKLKELDILKTKFFTNISHEFRTPLTLILGPVNQLISKINNQSDRKALSIVRQNANRLKELVNQLLSLSRLESGKMKLNCMEVNIVQFAKNLVQSFESLAKHKRIDLEFVCNTERIDVFVDYEKMGQVLINLLSNAFKFTGDGGKIIMLITPHEVSRKVNISISDTGQGIPPNQLKHIFDRFYQVDDSMSREHEGTGIGLSIVKEMVALHHGTTEVQSKPGVGTTFVVSLPLGKEHLKPDEIIKGDHRQFSTANNSYAHVSKYPKGNFSAKEINQINTTDEDNRSTLLIVEDNTDMRSFIRGYFEESYHIIDTDNGQVGFEKAVENIPDIIISDVMMPKMNGYELCQKLKTNEITCHIPVILLTARASKESKMEGLETGADDFITKPFDGEELQVRVANLIEQRKKLSEYYKNELEPKQATIKEEELSMDERFVRKARFVVEKNLSNSEYGVDKFAADMALSRVQLHRKLRALVNQSGTEFIRNQRLNRAVELLNKRIGNISEIAYDAGFNNPTYFGVSFKKRFGMSPSEYLDQLDQN